MLVLLCPSSCCLSISVALPRTKDPLLYFLLYNPLFYSPSGRPALSPPFLQSCLVLSDAAEPLSWSLLVSSIVPHRCLFGTAVSTPTNNPLPFQEYGVHSLPLSFDCLLPLGLSSFNSRGSGISPEYQTTADLKNTTNYYQPASRHASSS